MRSLLYVFLYVLFLDIHDIKKKGPAWRQKEMTATGRPKPRYSNLRFISFLLLTLILLFSIANNAVVLGMDETLYHYDLYDYFEMALRARAVIMNAFGDMQMGLRSERPVREAVEAISYLIPNFMRIHSYRPPLFMISSGLFLSMFKNISIGLAVMTNSFFMLILILSVYGAGLFFQGRYLGVLSAFMVTMIPGVFAFSRVLMPEFALMSLVALTFTALLYSRGFADTRFSLLAGIVMGLGALIKLSYPFFVIYPLIFAVLSGIKNVRSRRASGKTMARNILISLGAASLISLPWYISHFDFLVNTRLVEAFVDESNTTIRLYYLKTLACQQLFPFYFFALLLSVFMLARKRRFNFLSLMLLCMLAPISLLYIPQIRESRFTIAIMPFAALLISGGVVELKRKAITGVVVFFSVCQFFILSYLPASHIDLGSWSYTKKVRAELNWRIMDAGLFRPEKDEWWQSSRFAYELIKAHCPADKKVRPRILIFDMLVPLQDGLQYLSFKEKRPLEVYCSARGAVQDIPYEDPIDYAADVAESDFIIRLANPDKTGENNSCEGTIHYEKCREFIRVFNKQRAGFSLIGKTVSPGGPIEVFKRIDKRKPGSQLEGNGFRII